MGLMDNLRAQANQLAQKTQEAAQEGKARIDQAQASRRGDTLLRQLGAAVYADRTGRGGADSQSKIDQLISTISAHESQNGLNLSDQPQQGVPSQSPYSPQQQPGPGAQQSSFGQPGGPPPGTTSPSVDTSGTFFPSPDEEGPGSGGV